MKRRILSIILMLCLCLSGYPIQFASANDIDYVKLYGDFINRNDGFCTDLQYFLMDNYDVCDIAYLRDCYMVDLNNDSIPELFCIFCDELGPNVYAVLIEYDNGFKLGSEIIFNYNSGSAGSKFYRILKANGYFYYEIYNSVRQNYDDPDGWVEKDEILYIEDGEEKVFYSATSDFGVKYVNGKRVDEIDYEYVHNNFEIVAESGDYGEIWSSHEPQFGKDYDKFWDNKKEITVTVDGNKIEFDQQPIIVDGRTLVPLRAIFESLGANVEWDDSTQTITSTNGSTKISLSVGKHEMYKNGKLILLDVAPHLVDNRTLVPVRAVAEGFNCVVDWIAETQTVVIITSNRDKVINNAKNLYEANEALGGVKTLAAYAEVDALLYNTLNDIDVGLALNEITLDMVSAGTTATIAAAKVSTGDYTSVDKIGDGIRMLLSSSEIADVADGVLKDAVKQRIMNKIGSSVPDINEFIIGLGRDAYENNSEMITDLINVHMKFKNNTYTYDDAVAYIVLYDTLIMNRNTMSMAVQVLSDEAPDNFLDSLTLSAGSAAKSIMGGLFGDIFSGRDLNVTAELFTDIITAYTDYVCGESVNFFEYMKQINHPAIDEWVDEVESYNSVLAKKLCVE